MSNTVSELKPPQQDRLTRKAGSLKPKTIDKLPPNQRAWSDNVMRVLGLKSTSSQGRILAGAISSAEQVEQNGSNNDKLQARALRKTVIDAGTPPWKDARKAMAASDAKVHLDILSIPSNQRGLKALDPSKQGINQAFWIDRRDADGQDRHSFLCKPANQPDALDTSPAASGGPKGGEVAREALSGRAAQLLVGMTGIDIGMPESHVVKLDGSLIPGGQQGNQVTCSVQEARHAKGDMRNLNQLQMATLDPGQIAGIAIFDTMTLNTDRHAGNVLLDDKNNLIPIDHGESFAEQNDEGLSRLKATMGGPHNALLALPGAFSPMPQQMLKKLKSLDADKYAKGLAKDNAQIGAEHNDMSGAISDGAIENARRAATFVKLAAKNDPPLSPGAIQIAMANAAETLFDANVNDKQFKAKAQEIISRTAPRQRVLKEVFTAPNAEYLALAEKVEKLGWTVARRGGSPSAEAISDPLVMLKIVQDNVKPPKRFADEKAELERLSANPLNPQQALALVAANRRETVQQMMKLMAPAASRDMLGRIASISGGSPDDQMHDFSLLLGQAIRLATERQQERLDAFDATHKVKELIESKLIVNPNQGDVRGDAEGALQTQDPATAAAALDKLDGYAAGGNFLPASSAKMARELRKLGETLLIDPSDDDLDDGIDAAAKNDPFTAFDKYKNILERNKKGEFIDEPLDLIQQQLDNLAQCFLLDPTDKFVSDLDKAMKARNPMVASEALAELIRAANRDEFAPTEDGLEQLAHGMGVPDNDPDLVAAQQAIKRGDGKTAQPHVQNLRSRSKQGTYGDQGKRNVQQALDDLRQRYDIEDTNTDLALINDKIQANEAEGALPFIARLEKMGKAGAFPARQG
jgi:hypothetical protein